MTDSNIFATVIVNTCCYAGQEIGCQCGPAERVLRAYIDAEPGLPAMSREQREWCLSEIDSVEGYDRKEHESGTDSELARSVISAWMDYCRDKGMI
jgi:hypothetical protein